MGAYILIVEDDSEINEMLAALLQENGYTVKAAYSGTEALLCIEKEKPAAVILDLMLPGMPGEELLEKIRAWGTDICVIVTSAKDAVLTRVELLRAGADDYLVKPFDTQELLARLLAVLRRNRTVGGMGQAAGRLTFRDLVIEPDRHRVTVCGREVSLTRREYLILELFMSNPQKVFTKNNIYESVWNEEFVGEENAVNVHISNLRKKLAKAGGSQPYIQTVWGIGFKMKTL